MGVHAHMRASWGQVGGHAAGARAEVLCMGQAQKNMIGMYSCLQAVSTRGTQTEKQQTGRASRSCCMQFGVWTCSRCGRYQHMKTRQEALAAIDISSCHQILAY
eukprot:1160604-Pelagomonas_calceolata.AAC.2